VQKTRIAKENDTHGSILLKKCVCVLSHSPVERALTLDHRKGFSLLKKALQRSSTYSYQITRNLSMNGCLKVMVTACFYS
jgi:hypothetical protein